MFSAEKKSVYIQDDADKLTDAATGQPVPGDPPADLDTVRLNNRLRGIIDAAIGGLTLLSTDPAKRLDAAEAVFKSRQASTLPTVEAAIAKEQDPRIKLVLMQARAAIILSSDSASGRGRQDRLCAVMPYSHSATVAAIRTRSGVPQSISPAGCLGAGRQSRCRRHRRDSKSPGDLGTPWLPKTPG